MKPTGKKNPITGEEILKVEEHDINWEMCDWDELSDEDKVKFLSFQNIPFLSDENREEVIGMYEYFRDKNLMEL